MADFGHPVKLNTEDVVMACKLYARRLAQANGEKVPADELDHVTRSRVVFVDKDGKEMPDVPFGHVVAGWQ